MKCNLKVLLLTLGIFLGTVSTSIHSSTAQQPNQASAKQSLSVQQNDFILVASQQVKQRELRAFGNSKLYKKCKVLILVWNCIVSQHIDIMMRKS